MIFLISLLIILFIFLLLIFLHELGHFYIAKTSGVKILEFSIGFGPKMFQWKDSDGVTWSIRWIPFGGYVLPVSENLLEEVNKSLEQFDRLSDIEKVQFENELNKIGLDKQTAAKLNYSQSLESKKTTPKLLFALGGIIANYLIIWGALFFAYSTTGKIYGTNEMYYQVLLYDSAANEIGTVSNFEDDIFVSDVSTPDGTYSNFNQIDEEIWTNSNLSTINISFEIINPNQSSQNAGTIIFSKDTTGINKKFFGDDSNLFLFQVTGTPMSIIISDSNTYNLAGLDKMNFLDAFVNSFIDSWKYFAQGFVLLFYLVTPKQNITDGELVFINQSNGVEFEIIVGNYLDIIAILSALLISSNIIPIPPLDGYRFSVFLYEGLSKKKMKKETSQLLEKIGWGLIIFGTIWVIFIASF